MYSPQRDTRIAVYGAGGSGATVQAQVLVLGRRLQRELGMAISFVTHDLGVTAEIGERIAVMYAGLSRATRSLRWCAGPPPYGGRARPEAANSVTRIGREAPERVQISSLRNSIAFARHIYTQNPAFSPG